eukprot:4195349-Pleurochrysis_carterae.AAC.1
MQPLPLVACSECEALRLAARLRHGRTLLLLVEVGHPLHRELSCALDTHARALEGKARHTFARVHGFECKQFDVSLRGQMKSAIFIAHP